MKTTPVVAVAMAGSAPSWPAFATAPAYHVRVSGLYVQRVVLYCMPAKSSPWKT